MENAVNFVPSIQLVSEPNSSLIHKAGFFHSNATGQFFPIKRRPAFTERLRSVSLAHATVLTAVNQQAAFCLLESTQSNNVYQHTYQERGANSSNRDIEAQRKSAPDHCSCNWRRSKQRHERLERCKNGVRAGFILRGISRIIRSVRRSHERLARLRSGAFWCHGTAPSYFQIIPTHISSLTLLAGQPARV